MCLARSQLTLSDLALAVTSTCASSKAGGGKGDGREARRTGGRGGEGKEHSMATDLSHGTPRRPKEKPEK